MRIKGFIFICFMAFQISGFAQNTSRVDSMKNVIEKQTKKKFFEVWAPTVQTKGNFNSYEVDELIEAFIIRTKELNYEEEYAHFLFRKSLQKTIKGNNKEGLALIDQALPILMRLNSYLQMGCYNSAGGMIANSGDFEKGVEYLEKAILINKTMKMPEDTRKNSLINHYSVLGVIYDKHKDKDSAEKYYKLSFDLAMATSKHGAKDRLYAYGILAFFQIEKGEEAKAILLLRRGLEEAEVNNFMDIKADLNLKMGKAFLSLNKYDSAHYYVNKAIGICDTYKLKELKLACFEKRYNIQKKTKDYKGAVASLESYLRLRSKINKQNKDARTSFMVSQTKRTQEMLSKNKVQQIQQEEELKKRNLKIGIVFIGVLAIIGLLLGRNYYQRKKAQQELKAEVIEKELTRSQIRTINSQMNPHFVFNALNSVQDLIMLKDIRNSNIYLGKFADLMRQTLDYSQMDVISLEQELDTAKLYLDLEQLRFGDDFSYVINSSLSKSELDQTEIPSLLLQPYIENAIKHGLMHKKGLKKLAINLKKENNKLSIEIEDNGVGRVKSAEINQRRNTCHKSFAMKANLKRLDLIKESSGKEINFHIQDIEPSGTKITFTLS